MLLAYIDEIGETGAFISREDPKFNTSPAFGYAGFIIPKKTPANSEPSSPATRAACSKAKLRRQVTPVSGNVKGQTSSARIRRLNSLSSCASSTGS